MKLRFITTSGTMRRLVVLAVLFAATWVGGRHLKAAFHEHFPRPLAPRASNAPASISAPGTAGYLGVLAGESATIEPYASGRIRRVFVKPGDVVAKGARIAVLDSRTLQHDLAGARATYAEAAARLNRLRPLAKGPVEAVTPEELDEARFEATKRAEAVSSLSRTLADTNIVAPFAGIITEQYLYAGAVAEPGRPIVRMVGTGQPEVRFAVPESDVGRVAVGTALAIDLGSPAARVSGTVISVSPEVDSASGMVFATAALPSPLTLGARSVPGTLARIFAASDRSPLPPKG